MNKMYHFVLALIVCLPIRSVAVHLEWVVDERHIMASWPPVTVAWLEKHAVSSSLKQQIDLVLGREDIMDALSSIYSHYHISGEQLTLLLQEGFTFLGDKLNIFEIKAIPGYIFKMACPPNRHPELLNLGRIVEAEKIKRNLKAWKMASKIKIPKKYLYIVPFFDDIPYKDTPKVIVVAEKVPDSEKTKLAFRHHMLKIWLGLTKVPDLRRRNMLATASGLALIDTEPWNKPIVIPGLTKMVLLEHFRKQDEDDSDKTIDVFRLPSDHLMRSKINGVTTQGLMVHQRHKVLVTS